MDLKIENYIEIGKRLPDIQFKNSKGYFYLDNDTIFNKHFYEEMMDHLKKNEFRFIDYYMWIYKNTKDVIKFNYLNHKGDNEFVLSDTKNYNKTLFDEIYPIYYGSEYLFFPEDMSFIVTSEKGLEIAVMSVIDENILKKLSQCKFLLSIEEVKEKFNFLQIFDTAQERFFKNYPSYIH